ncbi:nucleotide exchange factor GrpE [Pleionea sediminis]|uniref:nucleotide exchange factor GrpE n=1 Tax=Pleionea sediminis TaxID=2569479 RepID=UPI001185D61E|nr:nucleotide exchange factor GrpE [Pleionea sediminis]
MSEQTHNETEMNSENLNSESSTAETAAEQVAATEEQGNEAQANESLESLMAKLQQAEATASEHMENALRAKAEADNIRRRAERDVQNAHKYALEGFVESLLPILDSLEQGLAQPAESDEAKALKEGMELTLKMFVDVLAKKNVEQLNPQGEPFNPELHEAMSMQENPEVEPNTVIAVFQKGYALNGRLVRPARVVVNKGKAPTVDTKA